MFYAIKMKNLIIFLLLAVVFVSIISFATSAVFVNKNSEGIPLPILMYHHILKDPSKHGAYVVSPQEFEDDLVFLKENGYQAITVSDLISYAKENAPLPQKPVMITFDDGYLSTLEYAHPLLEKYNMKAVVSVVASYTEEYSTSCDRHVSYAHLSWEDLRFMSVSGIFEVQNHTYDMHKNKKGERHGAKKVSGESAEEYELEFKRDVSLAQNMLSKNCDITPTCFTYPFGMVSSESEEFVKEMGFCASLSCFEGINYITNDPECFYLLKRFNRAHGRSAKKILK